MVSLCVLNAMSIQSVLGSMTTSITDTTIFPKNAMGFKVLSLLDQMKLECLTIIMKNARIDSLVLIKKNSYSLLVITGLLNKAIY